jgi:hypothetical protein
VTKLGDLLISDADRYALLLALEHNCGCDPSAEIVSVICPAHQMMADEDLLKHLLFVRTFADVFILEEWKGRE